MTPAFINTRKSTAMLLGIMPCTAHRHRGRFSCEWVIKPTSKIQPPIKVSSMDIPSRVSRLEERTDNHGDAARDMRIKHGQMEIDIQDNDEKQTEKINLIEKKISRLEGGLKVALWFGGVIGAAIMAVVDFFARGKNG